MAKTFVAVLSIVLIAAGCASSAPAKRAPLRPNPRIIERDLSPPVIGRSDTLLAGMMRQTSLTTAPARPAQKPLLVISKKKLDKTPAVKKHSNKRRHAHRRRK